MVQLQPGQSLYEALGVEKTAAASEIRKAYLKFAVQLHPDKNPGDDEAKERFQTLQKIYSVLSDPEKRKIYDRTGSLEDTEQFSGEQFDNLYNFYRSMYTTVTEQDINDFAATYKEGAEERADVLRYYEKFEGNMTKVFDWVMLSDPELDSHRYMDLVNAAIESGQVQKYKKYTTWATAVAKKKRPAPAVPGAATSKGGKGKKKGGNSSKGQDSEQALVAMMQQRQKRQGAFEGMLSSLASKYGVDDKEIPEEPTEEEFEAARKRLEANKASGSKKRQSSGDGEKKQQKKKK